MTLTDRQKHHHGATGKTPGPSLPVGAQTPIGIVIKVRKKKKYARRYLVGGNKIIGKDTWFRYSDLGIGYERKEPDA